MTEQTADTEDPYDLGDTELYPNREAEPYVKPGTGAESSAPPDSPAAKPADPSPESPPRNPDGTFATRKAAHPDWLLEQARDAGLSDDDLASMPTDAVGRYVRAVHRRTEAMRTEFATQRTVQESQVRPPPAPAPEEDDLGVDLADVHEPIANALRKLAKEKKALEARLEAQEARETQREVSSASDRIDAAFEALGPSYAKIVGITPASQMTEAHKAEYKRRIAVLREAGVTDLRQLPRDLKARLKEAAETLFGPGAQEAPKEVEPYAEVEKKNGKPRVTEEDWREAGLAKPTQRRGSAEPAGTAKAVRNLEQKLKEIGASAGDAEVLDGLL